MKPRNRLKFTFMNNCVQFRSRYVLPKFKNPTLHKMHVLHVIFSTSNKYACTCIKHAKQQNLQITIKFYEGETGNAKYKIQFETVDSANLPFTSQPLKITRVISV